jgi:hypothetical protein
VIFFGEEAFSRQVAGICKVVKGGFIVSSGLPQQPAVNRRALHGLLSMHLHESINP